MVCVRKGYLKTMELLLKKGADVNIQDDHLQTALHVACSKVRHTNMDVTLKCISLLIKYDIGINIQDVNGDTAIHICARSNLVRLLEAILSPSAIAKWQPRLTNKFKLTALQVAHKQGNTEAEAFLKVKQVSMA